MWLVGVKVVYRLAVVARSLLRNINFGWGGQTGPTDTQAVLPAFGSVQDRLMSGWYTMVETLGETDDSKEGTI